MNIRLELLKKENIDRFNLEETKSFDIHSSLFEDGIIPGPSEDEKDDFDLNIIMNNKDYTILEIYDDDTFIGGTIVKTIDERVKEIEIFYLVTSYIGQGNGARILEMVENYFPNTKIFRLITPSQVLRNVEFYVNKCGYHIVHVIEFNKIKNTCDFLFEKEKD